MNLVVFTSIYPFPAILACGVLPLQTDRVARLRQHIFNLQPVDTQPPKQTGQSPAKESTDHSADANMSDRDPEVGASVRETREGKPGQDGKQHMACVHTC